MQDKTIKMKMIFKKSNTRKKTASKKQWKINEWKILYQTSKCFRLYSRYNRSNILNVLLKPRADQPNLKDKHTSVSRRIFVIWENLTLHLTPDSVTAQLCLPLMDGLIRSGTQFMQFPLKDPQRTPWMANLLWHIYRTWKEPDKSRCFVMHFLQWV